MLNLILKLIYFLLFTDPDIGISARNPCGYYLHPDPQKFTDPNADPETTMSIRMRDPDFAIPHRDCDHPT